MKRMNVKRSAGFAGVLGAAIATMAISAVWAADWPGEGKFVAESAASFVNPDDPSTPFVMGEGMLLYTGSTTLTEVAMTVNVATGSGANTFNVQNADTTLTIAGKITQPRGNFVKAGPGTLALTYPGYQTFGPGPAPEDKMANDIKWDETTGACTNGGYVRFTIDEGTVIFGAPGQTNEVSGLEFIGNRSQHNVKMVVTNGVYRHLSNWFCLARGTGRTDNTASAELYVGKDAQFYATQLNMGYANGVANAYPRAKLTVDGGKVTVDGEIYGIETGNGKAEYVITNGGTFVDNQWNIASGGWQLKNYDGGTAVATVSARSTAKTRYLGMRPGSSLIVNGGSKFLFDRMMPNNASLGHLGTVAVDGSTLATEHTGNSHWFHCLNIGYYGRTSSFTVGANGLIIDVPTKAEAALFPLIDTATGVTAANVTIAKQGKGTAAICLPHENKIVVEEGDLRIRNRAPNVCKVASQTPTVAAGSKLIAAGEEAFANMTIPAGTPIVLRSQGMEIEKGRNWACNGWATVRPDGIISLTDPRANSVGSAFTKNKIDVTKSFILNFDIAFYAPDNVWYRDGGMAVVLCANSNWVKGNGGYNDVGYYNGDFIKGGTNSVAFGVHAYEYLLSYGQNGRRSGSTVYLGLSGPQMNNAIDAPHRATMEYDATAGKLTFTVKFRCGITRTISRDVNLATVLGASNAYLGFTGSTVGGGPVDYMVSNVALEDKGAQVATRTGGNVTASPSTPLEAKVLADAGDPALIMKRLNYSDGAILNIGSLAIGGNGEIIEDVELKQSAGWTVDEGAHWIEDGVIGLSYTNYTSTGTLQRKCGYALSPAPIVIDRDWTLDFDFAFGRKGGDVKADALDIGFLTGNNDGKEVPSNGFNVQCRYYESEWQKKGGTYNSTRLKFHKNGGEVFKSDWVDDCNPVRLYNTEAAHFTIVYSKQDSTLTITLADSKGTFTKTLSEFSMVEMLNGSKTAYLRLQGQVGGSWTENVVSNFKFEGAVDRTVASRAVAALGFDNWNGSGKVVKRGSGSLAVVSNSAQNVSVKVEEGGIYLAKEGVNDYYDTGRGGWLRSDKWLKAEACRGGVVVGAPSPTKDDHNRACDTHFTRRLPMGRSWTFSADCYALGFRNWSVGSEDWPGNAITIFAHNDPRGLSYTGGSGNRGGFGNSVQNGWGLNFFTYSDTSLCRRFCIVTSAAEWPNYNASGTSASFAPIYIKNDTTTHFVIVHDASAKTVKVTLSRGTSSSTTTFSNVDIKSCLGNNDYAWFGFGCGGGGAHGMFDWHNVRITFPDGADAEQGVNFLKDVEITAAESPVFVDSRRANGVFRLAPTVKVAEGSVLLARSVTLPTTLAMGTLTLEKGAIVGGDANTVVKPDAIVKNGDLKVEETTLALNSASELDDKTDIYLTNGAKLRLDFNGTMEVHRVYVDGVRQPSKTFDKTASWIDPASTGKICNFKGLMFILQ